MRARLARKGPIAPGLVVLFVLLIALSLGAAPAQANRALLSQKALGTEENGRWVIEKYPFEEQIEGACGLAVSPEGGSLYVSDYYHHTVVLFGLDGKYQSHFGVGNPPEGPCGLAFSSAGSLYANVWHQRAVRLQPTIQTIDSADSTGVAVDPSTDYLYVNDRTYVAVYEPSGAPVLDGGEPLRIGLGSLKDGYGVAAFGGKVYVPDAKGDTVKVYEPEIDVEDPIAVIKGPVGNFVSLVDAGIAVDPSNEHLLVIDNTQPGFLHPKAAIYEFDSEGTFLDQLSGSPVHGEPSGIAVAPDGTLYVTDGNSEEANVFKYSPYSPPGPGGSGPAPDAQTGNQSLEDGTASASPLIAGAEGFLGRSAKISRGQAELVQKGPIRIAVSGGLAPKRLPRKGTAPIEVKIEGRISSVDPSQPPQLRQVRFAFNRAGQLDRRGLARCGLRDIDPSTSAQALRACRQALVGSGHFSARVLLPEQSPFPSAGKVLAFNGNLKGKPVIFAHIYGTQPVPTSIVMPLHVHRAKGTFGTLLDASMQNLTGDWGYVTGISLKLGRKFSFKGKRRSFLSAGCPAPKGFPGALFPLARTTFSFVGGRRLSATLTRSCTVRG